MMECEWWYVEPQKGHVIKCIQDMHLGMIPVKRILFRDDGLCGIHGCFHGLMAGQWGNYKHPDFGALKIAYLMSFFVIQRIECHSIVMETRCLHDRIQYYGSSCICDV